MIDPYYSKSYFNIAITYGQAENFEEALTWALKAVEIDPAYVVAIELAGDCYMKLGQNEDACTYYRMAEDLGYNELFGKRVKACSIK